VTTDIESSQNIASPTVQRSTFEADVIQGLRQTPKRIPSKYFYDERGSQLFEEITRLPEYYLTRTEIGIFEECLPQIAEKLAQQQPYDLIEFGTGAGVKTQMLLTAIEQAAAFPRSFIPIDISGEQLQLAADELRRQFPTLHVTPIVADYSDPRTIAIPATTNTHIIFFPGSSIGNFTPDEASSFLRSASAMLSGNTMLILGVDLVKDKTVLEAAYNDAQGVTAGFNLNLIDRLNTELYTDIPEEGFKHVALFNERESRIEMHLEARNDIAIRIGTETFSIRSGERILTEYSYKYTPKALEHMLNNAGFKIEYYWTDISKYFTVCLCKLERKI
jgi:L-histidine N-alpha-methyltransferase